MGELNNPAPWDQKEFTVASLSPEDLADLAAGKQILLGAYQWNNNTNDNAFQIDLELNDIVPNITNGLPSWQLVVELQTQDSNDRWYAVGTVLNPFWNLERYPKRTHVVQPNFNAQDEYSTVDYDASQRQSTKTARKLPVGTNRIALLLTDPSHGTVGQEFISCKLSFYAETYGV